MASQTSKQIIAIGILPNISRSNGNQTMEFDQFIEYNMIIFFQKSYTKFGGHTSLRPYAKTSKLSISLDQHSEVLCSLF